MLNVPIYSPRLPAEGRSLPKPGAGIRTGNSLPGLQALRQAQAGHAYVAGKIIHVPGMQLSESNFATSPTS
jgi:hypothetical protein